MAIMGMCMSMSMVASQPTATTTNVVSQQPSSPSAAVADHVTPVTAMSSVAPISSPSVMSSIHPLPTTWVTDPLTGVTTAPSLSSAARQQQQMVAAAQPGRGLSPADAAASIAGMIMNPFIGYQQQQMQRVLALERMLEAQDNDRMNVRHGPLAAIASNRASGSSDDSDTNDGISWRDYITNSNDNNNDYYYGVDDNDYDNQGMMLMDDRSDDDMAGRSSSRRRPTTRPSTRFAPGDDPVCARISNCRQCANTYGCGWCSSSSACMAGDNVGPYQQPDQWSYCGTRSGTWQLYPGQCGRGDPWSDDPWYANVRSRAGVDINEQQPVTTVNYPFSNQPQPQVYVYHR